jgi:hypothetical protein
MQAALANLVGPIKPATHSGASYFLGITNSHTCYLMAILLHRKDDACNAIKAYLGRSPHGAACCIFHSDQGGEFVNKELQTYLCAQGIVLTTTPSHTPEYNGVAERFHQTVMGMVHTMLFNAGLDKALWGEAFRTAIIINNLLAMQVNPGNRTPYELWTGRMPDHGHLHIFRCKAYVLMLSQCGKLDERSRPAIYLGPAHESMHHH